MKFRYRVLEAGHERRGVIEAPDLDAARQMLAKRGQVILSLERIWEIPNPLRRGVPLKEMLLFTRQFAALYRARVGVIQALSMIAEQIRHKEFAETIRRIRDEVANGRSVAQALALEPRFFSGLFVEVVRFGELSGDLASAFQQMGKMMQREANLRRLVRRGTAYPSILLVLAVLMAGGMMTFVLPRLEAQIFSSGSQLPLLTFALLRFGRYLAAQWWVLLLLLAGALAYLSYYYQTPAGRANVDRLLLSMPLVSPLYRKVTVARFANALATLLSANLGIREALSTSGRVTQNVIVMAEVNRARRLIEGGASIAEGFRAVSTFPDTFHQVVAIGERSGTLSEMLTSLAADLDQEAQDAMESLSTVIEPVMLLFVAAIIGTIVLAIFLPMLQSYQLLQS